MKYLCLTFQHYHWCRTPETSRSKVSSRSLWAFICESYVDLRSLILNLSIASWHRMYSSPPYNLLNIPILSVWPPFSTTINTTQSFSRQYRQTSRSKDTGLARIPSLRFSFLLLYFLRTPLRYPNMGKRRGPLKPILGSSDCSKRIIVWCIFIDWKHLPDL